MTDLLKMMGDIFNPNNFLNQVHPLAAIWMNRRVFMGSGASYRVAPGETVRVNEANELVDIGPDQPATHLVKECHGTSGEGEHYLYLEHLETKEPLKIKL